ncbi:MAG TPA: oligosaccharide flippase family protein [Methanofastidiosum sp.]|nr:oligosaccharide flippase family protein [Methanofastidiosum sp.]HQK63305.1 oligosaccharide flippase family protein [Methanofastidiosum sp.]
MENDIFKNMLKISGSTTITQIMGILVLPILSRVYSPENFGVYALFFSISNILLIIATWQYDVAIVIPKKYEDSLSLFFLSILLLSFMSLGFFLIMIFFNTFILNLFRLNDLSRILFLIPVHIFISGFYQSLRYLNSRNNAFGNTAKSSIINSGITYFSQIILGILFLDGSGLVYGSIFGSLLATIFLLFVSVKFISIKSVNFTGIRKVMYGYKKFPTVTTLGNFLSGVGGQLPVLLLSSFFGTVYSGFYSIANKAINIPSRIIAGSISEVSYKHTSDIINDNKLLSTYFEKSTAAIFQISILPFLIIFLFGRILVTFFLGNDWAVAGLYIQILSPLIFLQFLNSPIGIFLQKNRNDILLGWQVMYLIFSAIGLISGYVYGGPTVSIINFSLLLSICYIISIYLNFRLVNASFKNMIFNIKKKFYLKKFLNTGDI